MVDNLEVAVLQRVVGEAPVFNPRYKDFADHWALPSPPAASARPRKGRVENGVGYVKKNFLAGLEFTDFCAVNPAARQWLDARGQRAHPRQHQTPARRVVRRESGPRLRPPARRGLTISGAIQPARANSQFRVALDTNTYSVPRRVCRGGA